MHRSLVVLMLAQIFAMTGPPVVVLLGGIVGSNLAPAANLATLPVAFLIVGTALATIPAAMIMARIGRKAGFIFSAAVCGSAALLAAYSISISHFWLFCLATLLIGSNNAFVQQYRFAVAEAVPVDRVGKSLSILMLSGVVAAWMGPEMAEKLHNASEMGAFSGSFIGLAVMMCVAIFFLSFYRNKAPTDHAKAAGEQRTLGVIALQPAFLLAVGAAAVAYGVMSLLMTATPVSMHTVEQFSLEDTKWVIQSHIMAMFLPSFFSGFLVDRFGARTIIAAGMAILSICLIVAFMDRHLIHYWFALVLLGIGWNFMFLGGTTLLTSTYTSSESYKVQALNDFLVFSIQACGALGSGYLLMEYGWNWVLGFSVPWIAALAILMFFTRPRTPNFDAASRG